MRAREFITEDRVTSRGDGELADNYEYPNTGAVTNDEMDRYYDFYRAGMLMGRTPADLDGMEPGSWINNRPYFGYYTKEEKAKIDGAFKALKLKPQTLVEPGSQEPQHINKVSPVKGFKGYPR